MHFLMRRKIIGLIAFLDKFSIFNFRRNLEGERKHRLDAGSFLYRILAGFCICLQRSNRDQINAQRHGAGCNVIAHFAQGRH